MSKLTLSDMTSSDMTSSDMTSSDLNIEKYSEYSLVLRGNTKELKEEIKQLGGKYNARLKNGPGWIFSNALKDKLEKYVNEKKGVQKENDIQKENQEENDIDDLNKKIQKCLEFMDKQEQVIKDLNERLDRLENRS